MAFFDQMALQRACWDGAASAVIAYTGTAAKNSSDLAAGLYYAIATTDCYFRQGSSGMSDAASTDNFLPAKTPVLIQVTGSANARVSAVRVSSSGSLYVMAPSGG